MDLGYVFVGPARCYHRMADAAPRGTARTVLVVCLRLVVGAGAADEPGFGHRPASSLPMGRYERRLRIASILDHAAYFASVDYSLLPSLDRPQLSAISPS